MDNMQEIINAVLPIVVAILFAFVAGGTTVATLFALVFRSVLRSPVLLSTLEKLYGGLSPEWQDVLKSADAVLDEVTDDTPVEVAQKALARANARVTVAEGVLNSALAKGLTGKG